MTALDLDAVAARADAATPGPWDVVPDEFFARIGTSDRPDLALVGSTAADAEFIAHARADVPALVAENRDLRDTVAAQNEILEAYATAFPRMVDELHDLRGRLARYEGEPTA